jgi:hypothetical protein
MVPANDRPQPLLCFHTSKVGVSLHYSYRWLGPSQYAEFFVLVDCFVMWCSLEVFQFTNKQARDLFCKASPGNIDLIRTPGTVGTSFSVGDRVSRPLHETGFPTLVDQYIWKMQ